MNDDIEFYKEIERRRLQSAYILELSEIVGYEWKIGQEPSAKQMWLIVTASPEQRHRAARRAIAKDES